VSLAEYDITPEDFDLPGTFDSRGTRRAMALQTNISTKANCNTDSDKHNIDKSGQSYRLVFTLPPGAYATAVLREYLKVAPAKL
jgi:Uncharacterized conserved protein